MQFKNSSDMRETEMAKLAQSAEGIAALQKCVKEIIEGSAFKGSQRSAQFLKYVVDQAVAGHLNSLKERIIGVELFGRSPTYDTGEDAIVRVAASDVRKRLLQHYGTYGASFEFRLHLPLGSYVPEIVWEKPDAGSISKAADGVNQASTVSTSIVDQLESEPTKRVQEPVRSQVPAERARPLFLRADRPILWLGMFLLFTVANLLLFAMQRLPSFPDRHAQAAFPWTTLLTTKHAVRLILSDPDIAEVQDISGGQISASEYANHKYIPDVNPPTPEARTFIHAALQGNKAASVDVPTALTVTGLAQTVAKHVDVYGARSVQLSDLRNDDNFIFLGSPRSNPWTYLYANQLDFRFVFDQSVKQEYLLNVHPRIHERPAYVPTAGGLATGQSFAIIAFIQNPDQAGQVLLLAGTNAEGTEAAGRFVTDLPRISRTLEKCGVSASGAAQHFEVLLGVNSMAGSPTNMEVLACHVLPTVSEK